MQMLARAGEDFAFLSRFTQPKCPQHVASLGIGDGSNQADTPEAHDDAQPDEKPEDTMAKEELSEQPVAAAPAQPPPLAPASAAATLDFVCKATSALKSASYRARRALVELKDDLVADILIDFGQQQQPQPQQQQQPAPQQQQPPPSTTPQQQGWNLPWAPKSVEARQRDETQRRVLELSKEPYRFLVPSAESGAGTPFDAHAELEAAIAAALEVDPALANLKEELVPRMLSESQFWRRYFIAIREIELEVFRSCSPFASSTPGPSSPRAAPIPCPGETTPCALLGHSVIRVLDLDDPLGDSSSVDSAAQRCASETAAMGSMPRALDVAARCVSDGGPPVDVYGMAVLPPADVAVLPGADVAAVHTEGLVPQGPSNASSPETCAGKQGACSSAQGSGGEAGAAQKSEGLESTWRWLRAGLSRDPSPGRASVENQQQGQGRAKPLEAGEREPGLSAIARIRSSASPLAGDAVPKAASLRHLAAAHSSAAKYRTCADLLSGLSSDSALNWNAFAPLAAVSGSFRRQSIPFSPVLPMTSPPRLFPWQAASLNGSGEAGETARGVRSPQMQGLVELLFRPRSMGESPPIPSAGGLTGQKPLQSFARALHGAPRDSFVSELAQAMSSLASPHEMAQLWLDVVSMLGWHFKEGHPVPGVVCSRDHPDLQMCEIMQHLQLLNLCIERRHKRDLRLAEALAAEKCFGEERLSDNASAQSNSSENDSGSTSHDDRLRTDHGNAAQPAPSVVGRMTPGEAAGVRRRGAKERASGLCLLETGEPMYIPETQEPPLMTESAMREAEELIMRTGSIGSGCRQLFSDMQAFKAANPGCILEDFVRWYSPPDWSPVPYSHPAPGSGTSPRAEASAGAQSNGPISSESDLNRDGCTGGVPMKAAIADACIPSEAGPRGQGAEAQELTSGPNVLPTARRRSGSDVGREKRGYLSVRMTFSGNLWQELWSRAEAVPAFEQPSLFDVEEAGQSSLNWLTNLGPSEMLEQMLIVMVGVGLSGIQALPAAAKDPLRTCLAECGRYVTGACCRGMGSQKQQYVCMIYEVLEAAKDAASLAQAVPVDSVGGDISISSDGTARPVARARSEESYPTHATLPGMRQPGSDDEVGDSRGAEDEQQVQAALRTISETGLQGAEQDIGLDGVARTSSDGRDVARIGRSLERKDVEEAMPVLKQAASALFQRLRTSGPAWKSPFPAKPFRISPSQSQTTDLGRLTLSGWGFKERGNKVGAASLEGPDENVTETLSGTEEARTVECSSSEFGACSSFDYPDVLSPAWSDVADGFSFSEPDSTSRSDSDKGSLGTPEMPSLGTTDCTQDNVVPMVAFPATENPGALKAGVAVEKDSESEWVIL